jgi:prepilin-type N-terminal cleavage/methylation domain-containing protein
MTKRHSQQGFTLIELMTSLAIFTIIVTISLGSILGIFAANRKSRALRAIMGNLNLAVETMSREMRYGSNYHCGSAGDITQPNDCANGDTFMSFLSSDGIEISYRLTGTTLERREGASGDWLPFVAPAVAVSGTPFYASGTGDSDSLQPKVLIKIQGMAGGSGPDRGGTNFTLQSLVSQRVLDTAGASAYTYPTPATYYSLTVTKAGTGSGTVSGSGISCGSTCSSNYVTGTGAALSASATAGSTFSGWSGACSGTGSCNLTINANKAVTATFALSYATPYTYQYQYQAPAQACWEQYGYGVGAGCPGDNICLYGGYCSDNSCWPAGYPRANVNGCCSGAEVGGGEICP